MTPHELRERVANLTDDLEDARAERDRLRVALATVGGAIEGWEITVINALRADNLASEKMPEEPRGTFEFLLERLKAEGDDLRALLNERSPS